MMYEFKKLWHQKSLVYMLLVFFIMAILQSFAFSPVTLFTQDKSSVQYAQLLQEYRGSWTEDKNASYQNAKDELAINKQRRIEIYEEIYQSGTMLTTQEAQLLKDDLRKVNAMLSQKEAFDKLEEQILYVAEDPQHREIINPLGWKQIIQNDSLNFFLIFCLMLINIPIFMIEYESDMRHLSVSTYKGKKQVFINKCSTGFIMSLLIILVFFLLRDIPLLLSYDYSDAFSPILSVPTFVNMNMNLSCIMVLILIRLIQLLGYLFFCGVLWVLSVFIKKFIPVFSITLILIFLLNYGLSEPMIYFIPSPLGMMKGSGFFRGNEQIILNRGSQYESAIDSYQGGNKALIYIVTAAFIFLFIIGLIKAYHDYSNIKSRRSVKRTLMMIACALLLTGCSENTDTSDTENGNLNQVFHSYQDGVLYTKEKDIYYVDLNTSVKTEFLKDTIAWDEGIKERLTKNENNVCYISRERTSEKINNQFNCYDVEHRNISTIYSDEQQIVSNQFFGFIKQYHISIEDAFQINDILNMFIYNENYYVLDGEHRIIKINGVHQDEKETLSSDYLQNAILFDGSLYYISTDMDLKRLDLATEEAETIDQSFVSGLVFSGNSLIYTTANKPGVFEYKDSNIEIIAQVDGTVISANAGYLYMKNKEEEIVCYHRKNNEIIHILDKALIVVEAFDDYVLALIEENGTMILYKYSIDMQNNEKLLEF